jgi:HTH-type transcriptional regulator/antitoxin HigA
LMPQAEWKNSPASKLKSPDAAQHLAKKLGIHPAIVAGRIRHESKEYRLLNNLVGHKKIRVQFERSKPS